MATAAKKAERNAFVQKKNPTPGGAVVVWQAPQPQPFTSLTDCGLPRTLLRPLDEGQETNRTLYIGDLSFFVTEEILKERLQQVCLVKSVKLILHPETQEN